jgi:sugar/nucleoside kinase (ribokinase family)
MSYVSAEMGEMVPILPRILGLGVACVDMIACVEEYPKADEKIRAESVTLLSGGNVGNTLTAISRLGAADAMILTKIGKDSNGEFVMDDLRKAGVNVSNVVVSTTSPTLLVYVIVDKQAKRTCIASPNEEELTPTDVETKLHILNPITGMEEDGILLDGVQVSVKGYRSIHSFHIRVTARGGHFLNLIIDDWVTHYRL